MTELAAKQNIYTKLLKGSDNRIPILAAVSFLLLSAGLMYLGIIVDKGIYVLAGIAVISMVVVFVRNPRIWIYSVGMFTFLFFRDMKEGVSVLDVMTGVFFLGTLSIWLLWQLVVTREKLIENTADRLLLFFFLFMILNIIIAIFNAVDPLDWIREFTIFSLILYAFPIKRYFKEKKHIMRLMILMAVVVIGVDFMQFWQYYKALGDLVYAYQLSSTVRVNQTLYTAAVSMGVVFALYQKRFSRQLIWVVFSAVTIGALVTSFSRTFWIILMLNIVLMYFFMTPARRRRLLTYSVVIAVAVISLIIAVFGDNTMLMYEMIEKRFTSSTQGTKDISLQARFDEWSEVTDKIQENPLAGNGMHKKFHFFNPIDLNTTRTANIHNGYLYISYRAGIPLAIFFFAALFIYAYRSYILSKYLKSDFYRMLAVGSMMTMLLLILSDFTSAQIATRDGVFVLAFTYAFISAAEKKYKEEQTAEKSLTVKG
ncbi:MAG: O-antigen ligase family protein [Candidatus Kapabacteria bacterium]|jgi:O-antigen ligase|nr:O-antigen ligase family protein [Candidatus Kapabacteria bacterium]